MQKVKGSLNEAPQKMDVAIFNCTAPRSFPFGFDRIYIDLIYYKLPAKVRPWIMRQMKVGRKEEGNYRSFCGKDRIAKLLRVRKNHLQILCPLWHF